jgi:hypothetical protein
MRVSFEEVVMVKSRGSEKLLAAWKSRVLTDEAFKEIAGELEKSPAVIEEVSVVGGANATGVMMTLSYSGDDIPRCGNDLAFWLKWHRVYGGRMRPPRILINGIPFPDLLRVQLEFGDVGGPLREVSRFDRLDQLGGIDVRGR